MKKACVTVLHYLSNRPLKRGGLLIRLFLYVELRSPYLSEEEKINKKMI